MKPLTKEQQKDNEERFEKIILSIQRDGVTKLVEYLKKKDFYSAPAGLTGELACPGGLLQHSLNVYDRLMKKTQSDFWKESIGTVTTETIIIVSLFANICYVSYFEAKYQNKQFIRYFVNDKNPYGKGEKTVWIISTFMKLNSTESYSLRWFLEDERHESFCTAVKLHPLVLALCQAEKEARYIMEARE